MRPLRTTRWPPAQLRRPVILSPLFAHRTRQFHATRPNHIFVGILSGAIDFLHGIHSATGLPWAASIPLAALSVRTFIAFPILIWTRLKLRRRDDALPLLVCMKLHYSKTIGEAALMNKLFMRSEDNVRELQKELQGKISGWYKKWKIPRTSIAVVPLIQLPVWVTMMEAIRHICGVEMGLFRYFSPANAIHGPQVQGLSGAEPTLATEGALWFSDLLAGDSTGILPLMLTFSILGNLRGSIATKTFAEASDLEKPQMIVQIFLKFTKYFGQAFALYIGLIAHLSGMPAGLLLYWITSTNVATLQTLFVNNYLFVNKPMTAARQMHIRVLKPGEKPPPVKKLLQ